MQQNQQQLQVPNDQQQTKINQDQTFVFCWGNNEDYQLSIHEKNETSKIIYTPQHPKGLRRAAIKYISSGYDHSAVVTSNGKLLICGKNLVDKLGTKIKEKNVKTFTLIEEFKDKPVKQAECGFCHTLGLLENGDVYAWGGNLHGKLGGALQQKPSIVTSLQGIFIKQIACGQYHSVAVSDIGEVHTWGSNEFGQTGHGQKMQDQPRPKQLIINEPIEQITCGDWHTLALSQNKNVYSWGQNSYGQCGFKDSVQEIWQPQKIEINLYKRKDIFQDKSVTYIKKVVGGGKHTLFLTNDGLVYCCGYNQFGQLGLKHNGNQESVKLINSLLNKKIIDIAAGTNHSLVITDKGDLFSCGNGAKGELGLEEKYKNLYTFTHVMNLAGWRIKGIYSGGNHSWVSIDEGDPYIPKNEYIPPSPVKNQDQSSDSFSENGFQSMGQENQQQYQLQKSKQQNILKQLTVIYTDVDLCHRFIRFTIKPNVDYQEVSRKVQTYIDQESKSQDYVLKYSKLQDDEEIVKNTKIDSNSNNKQQQMLLKLVQSKESIKNSFTLMMVCDTSDAIENYLNQNNKDKENINYCNKINTKESIIGKMGIINEIITKNQPLEQLMSSWAFKFIIKHYTYMSKIKCIEMRPHNVYPDTLQLN